MSKTNLKLYISISQHTIIYRRYQNNLDLLISELKETGVDGIFTWAYLDFQKFKYKGIPVFHDVAEFRRRCLESDIEFHIICPVFDDSAIIKSNPDYLPVDHEGNLFPLNSGLFSICPNRKLFNQKRLDTIQEITKEFTPNGIALSFIHFPVELNKIFPDTPRSAIKEYCFCDTCLAEFQDYIGIDIPPESQSRPEKVDYIMAEYRDDWYEWRVHCITEFVRKVSSRVTSFPQKPKRILNLIPWLPEKYENGLIELAGQDITRLQVDLDIIMPILQLDLIHQNPAWVGNILRYLNNTVPIKIIPAIKMGEYVKGEKVPLDEIKLALTQIEENHVLGIHFSDWLSIVENSEILNFIKEKFGK